MKRIFEDNAYGDAPVAGCYWDTTVARPPRGPALEGSVSADVAIVGGGYTGLSAALHLAADHGVDVALLEANGIGWGASGRNGGFACIGGAKVSDAVLASRFGTEGLDEWHRVQKASADLVADLLERHAIEADAHSRAGEVVMAHRASDMAALRAEAPVLGRSYGVEVDLIERTDLVSEGLAGPQFHGAMRFPLGFALNPLKYALGLARGARKAGARIHEQSAVTRIERGRQGGYVLHAGTGRIEAKRLILATNGYSSEDLPDWMCARYLPAQSCVLVTRPLAAAEIGAQGWSSDHMAYDTRRLLHYFRLMPNRRFLFGMRGGVRATPAAHAALQARIRADFEAMFPAWAGVETPSFWSGLVCLARSSTPYVGRIGDWQNAWTGFGWHGNGVLLASYAGKLLAAMAVTKAQAPAVMAASPRRFPLGSWRRGLLAAAYGWYGLRDWW
ncbi:MAG: FAD-binding oxidoreductase [Rhodobacteraceae bacterium]|nr:FAD-binding oxidoreductase [Paracoccaceae bacterium]MCP5341679.1 FAD-binding oxidoreductase [Paracoccaceae bacterium]